MGSRKGSIVPQEEELGAVTTQAFERRIQKLERENKELTRKLTGLAFSFKLCTGLHVGMISFEVLI